MPTGVHTRHQAPGVAFDLDVRAGCGGSATVGLVREPALRVGRSGRPLRILAQMEHLAPPDAGLEELIAREMDVAELTGHGVPTVRRHHLVTWETGDVRSGLARAHPRRTPRCRWVVGTGRRARCGPRP